MKKYNYSKELVKSPLITIWKLNFEKWPASSIVLHSIQKSVKELATYQPSYPVVLEKFEYPSSDQAKLPFYLISPSECSSYEKLPVLIYYHGGGFFSPLVSTILENASYYAAALHCRVFLPEYHTTPSATVNMIITDCYNALLYAVAQTDHLGIDMSRFILLGDSAGAAIAAGIAHYSRDQHGPIALGQVLIYPVLDHHLEKYESMNKYADAPWSKKANIHMWNLLLKSSFPSLLPYLSPMNQTNFSNLPPAYIEPQEIDTLCDQGVAYASLLRQSGISTELNIIKGSYHGFDFDHSSPLVNRVLKQRVAIMKRMFLI